MLRERRRLDACWESGPLERSANGPRTRVGRHTTSGRRPDPIVHPTRYVCTAWRRALLGPGGRQARVHSSPFTLLWRLPRGTRRRAGNCHQKPELRNRFGLRSMLVGESLSGRFVDSARALLATSHFFGQLWPHLSLDAAHCACSVRRAVLCGRFSSPPSVTSVLLPALAHPHPTLVARQSRFGLTLVACFAASAVTTCDRPLPLDLAGPRAGQFDVEADPSPPDTSLAEIGPGIGGKYTMYAWGNHLDPMLPLQPSGLRPPPGIPVRVVMRGEIGLELADEFIARACSNTTSTAEWQACYDGYARILIESVRPLGPWGDRSDVRVGGWEGDPYDAALYVSWDGATGATTPDSLVRVFYHTSGQELWVGREGRHYVATFGNDPDTEYPVYVHSAGFVLRLDADDGSRPATDSTPARAPQLALSDAGTDTTASGAPGTRYRLAGVDGQLPQGVEWYFVPDVIRDNKPIVIAASPALASDMAESASVSTATADGEWFRPQRLAALDPTIHVGRPRRGPGKTAPQIPVAPRPALTTLASEPTYTTYSDCAGAMECVIPDQGSPGTVVAVAVVGSGRWSADSRQSQEVAGLKIACIDLDNPAGKSVPRGSYVYCDRIDETTVVARWRFVPDSAEFIPVEHDIPANGNTVWQGTVATSGIVWAYGWRNAGSVGQPMDSGSTRLNVTPRQWQTFGFPSVVDSGQGPLLYPPPAIHELGRTWVSKIVPPSNTIITATAGPNTGFALVRDLPFGSRPIFVATNLAALQESSSWWAMQVGGIDSTTGRPWCGKTGLYSMSMAELTKQVRQHEGIDPTGATSHVAVYQSVVKDHDLNGIAEAIVQQESAANDTTAAQRVFNRMAKAVVTWQTVNHAENRAEVDLGLNNPFNPPCQFRF